MPIFGIEGKTWTLRVGRRLPCLSAGAAFIALKVMLDEIMLHERRLTPQKRIAVDYLFYYIRKMRITQWA